VGPEGRRGRAGGGGLGGGAGDRGFRAVGVGGWSYGGILTNELIARDRRFKAAISARQGNAFGGYGTDQYVLEYEAELGRPGATWRPGSGSPIRSSTPTGS
jgi:hypothetical protein